MRPRKAPLRSAYASLRVSARNGCRSLRADAFVLARSLPPADELHGAAEGQAAPKLERATAPYTPLVRARRGGACGGRSALSGARRGAGNLFDAPTAARAACRTSASA
jgi:hypothetical protein